METKYLSLRHPVELGSRFGDWQVCWLGGWGKHRLYHLVMLVKFPFKNPFANRPVPNPNVSNPVFYKNLCALLPFGPNFCGAQRSCGRCEYLRYGCVFHNQVVMGGWAI